ncbi:hypothetical protein JYT97_01575 [Haliea sp. AH-315-K21]|uniref:IrrE N-terminal-like domain-containing protein n=1 Tax=SAR86 cluster bacterium TaxID=2030880 RepID=A0A2A5CCJ6_9GAMM|nr:hypothetical protein [Haliea sp. AH-315-K21]PCJ41180.1 MAG: hypothetical protein COA71_09055 [SAR86 cluster bacterium]
MSYKDLYHHRQTLPFYVKKTEILKLAQQYSDKKAMLVRTGKLTSDVLRGLYLSVEDPRRLKINYAQGVNIIFFARDEGNNKCWQRLVIMKEAMHLFDNALESASTSEDFNYLLDDIVMGAPGPKSAGMRSEGIAFWRALSLFLPEEERSSISQRRANGELSDEEIAERVKMPLQHAPQLFGPHYKAYLEIVLAG